MYGDSSILQDQYESIKKWILFMQTHSHNGIWNYKLQFGDWVALDAEEGSYFGATPNDLTCTAYFAYSTMLAAKIAAVLRKAEDAEYFQSLYQTIVETFRATFFRPDGSMTAQTQTAHILALWFDLVPEKFRKKTADRLAELLREHDGHLVTGFLGTPHFCHALSRNGYPELAYDLLLREDYPSWLYQVKRGATTIWEHWDGIRPDGSMWSPAMNSFNHYAYGAVGEWLYRAVLGIEADEHEPGFRHTILSPQTSRRLRFCEGAFESAYGTLRVRWERDPGVESDLCRLWLTIPHNSTAEIRLEAGAFAATCRELHFETRSGVLTADCGSGNWEIEYRLPPEEHDRFQDLTSGR